MKRVIRATCLRSSHRGRRGAARSGAGGAGEVARRNVADGREFDIVKRWWVPEQLERELAGLGWQFVARATANRNFIFAVGSRC